MVFHINSNKRHKGDKYILSQADSWHDATTILLPSHFESFVVWRILIYPCSVSRRALIETSRTIYLMMGLSGPEVVGIEPLDNAMDLLDLLWETNTG